MHSTPSDAPPGDNARVKKSAVAATDFYIRIPHQDVDCRDLITVYLREPGDKSDRPLFCGSYAVLVEKCKHFINKGARLVPEFMQVVAVNPILGNFYAELKAYAVSCEREPATDLHVPGAKDDSGKVRMELVLDGFPRALAAVAEVATFGARKYTDGGWAHVTNGVTRYRGALYRHMNADAAGELRDAESDLSHVAHAAWNALAVLELYLREQEEVQP